MLSLAHICNLGEKRKGRELFEERKYSPNREFLGVVFHVCGIFLPLSNICTIDASLLLEILSHLGFQDTLLPWRASCLTDSLLTLLSRFLLSPPSLQVGDPRMQSSSPAVVQWL